MKTKNDYQQCLHIYLKRREEYKKKGKNVSKLRAKINGYRIQIKRIEEKEDRMKEISKEIEYFLGVSPKKERTLARKFFYRFCLENGINSWYIRHFTGVKCDTTISNSRKALIKNKTDNELYKRFINYVKKDDENN